MGIQKSNGKYVCIMMSDSSDTVEDLNYYYKEITSEEVFYQRKNKFLKIGREKGFISNLENLSDLNSKKTIADQFFSSKKKIFFVIGVVSLIAVSLFIFL